MAPTLDLLGRQLGMGSGEPPPLLPTRPDDVSLAGPVDSQPYYNVYVLQCICLGFGTLSVTSVLFAFYWFVRMRRAFRHDLIMLLIQSDFVKALWFVIFPIVNFTSGPVPSNSAFCQVSGFFLAVGIESADIAVLLISCHSAWYILRPSGLYPFRKYAYAIYIVFPLVMASLAFLDGSGYENMGNYCYLRTDEFWARMALSWVPRYVISFIVVVTYAYLYWYVETVMRKYDRRTSASTERCQGRRRGEVPPTPPIVYHGLIPSTPSSRRGSAADARVPSVISSDSVSKSSTLREQFTVRSTMTSSGGEQRSRSVTWDWSSGLKPERQQDALSQRRWSKEEDTPDIIAATEPLEQLQIPSPVLHAAEASISDAPSPTQLAPPEFPDAEMLNRPSAKPETFWNRSVRPSPAPTSPQSRSNTSLSAQGRRVSSPEIPSATRPRRARTYTGKPESCHSMPTIFGILRSGPSRSLTAPIATADGTNGGAAVTPVRSPSMVDSIFLTPGAENPDATTQNRDKMRRQLRALFVYPLVYVIIWVFPFVSHVAGYDDALSQKDPLWLLILSMASLCVQGAVDSLLFTCRERPWLHAKRGFWEGLGRRVRSVFPWVWLRRGRTTTVGRTRDEMLVDGRIAKARRQEEMLAEREERLNRNPAEPVAAPAAAAAAGVAGERRRAPVEWWDFEDFDEIRDDTDDDEDEFDEPTRRSDGRDAKSFRP